MNSKKESFFRFKGKKTLFRSGSAPALVAGGQDNEN